MKIKTWIKYTEGYLPTKRCRKMRYRELEDYIDIELKEVSMFDTKKKYQVEDTIYYEYNDKLYIKAGGKTVSNYDIEDPIENLKHCNENCSSYFGFEEKDTREKMIEKAKEDINKYLLIDGELYTTTFKPFYRVYTFGLGNNRGGTSLSICSRYYDYIPNEQICFDANEREEAIKEALDTAINRGDTKSIDRIKNVPMIIEY